MNIKNYKSLFSEALEQDENFPKEGDKIDAIVFSKIQELINNLGMTKLFDISSVGKTIGGIGRDYKFKNLPGTAVTLKNLPPVFKITNVEKENIRFEVLVMFALDNPYYCRFAIFLPSKRNSELYMVKIYIRNLEDLEKKLGILFTKIVKWMS